MIDFKTLAAQEKAHLVMESIGFAAQGGAELRRLAMRYLALRENCGVFMLDNGESFNKPNIDAAADRLIQEMLK